MDNQTAFLQTECIESIKYFRTEIKKEDAKKQPNQDIITILMMQIHAHQLTLDSIQSTKLN